MNVERNDGGRNRRQREIKRGRRIKIVAVLSRAVFPRRLHSFSFIPFFGRCSFMRRESCVTLFTQETGIDLLASRPAFILVRPTRRDG